jgi:hypothetical protein
LSGLVQGRFARRQRIQGGADLCVQIIGRQIGAKRICRGRKTGWHKDTLRGKRLDHFAQRRVFSTDGFDIATAQFGKIDNKGFGVGHGVILQYLWG